jgi:chromosome segregation ATPase
MAAITRDRDALRAAVPLAQERFHMQMADAEAAAVREAHHRMEQQQLFQFMTKTMQSLSAGTVERDGRIDAMQRTVQSLEQALALAVGEAARAETERSAGAAALATATSEVHSLSSDLDAARAAAAAAASALADARTVAEQATAALAAAERERDALFRALDAANQGAATAADMMRYVEERDAQAARDRAAVEAAHTQVRAMGCVRLSPCLTWLPMFGGRRWRCGKRRTGWSSRRNARPAGACGTSSPRWWRGTQRR